jgi:hypothetical protein
MQFSQRQITQRQINQRQITQILLFSVARIVEYETVYFPKAVKYDSKIDVCLKRSFRDITEG